MTSSSLVGTVHDRGETDNQLWISTQYVDGTDAARLQKSRYPAGLPAVEVTDITAAIASALDYASVCSSRDVNFGRTAAIRE